GTSIGSTQSIRRMGDLLSAFGQNLSNAPTLFLSLEPLHGELDRNQFTMLLDFFQWVIVGGESGNETGKYRYRPCKLEWIELIIKNCRIYNVPVFVKQLGTHLSKELELKDRHGGDINEWPKHLRI